MRKRNRMADAALGLVVGLGIALLFLVWADPGFRHPPDSQIGKQHADNTRDGDDQPIQSPGFWKTYTTPTDTYAQWVAAFSALFSVAVSIWAVRLVRNTLVLNRDATIAAQDAVAVAKAANTDSVKAASAAYALAARQFEAGFKPWLSVKVGGPYIDELKYPLKMFEEGEGPRWTRIQTTVELKNIGEMPAIITGFYIGVENYTDIEINGWGHSKGWHELGRGETIFLNENFGKMAIDPSLVAIDPALAEAHCGGFMLTAENRNMFFRDFPPIVGRIDYEDPLGKKRQMGFAFRPGAAWTSNLMRWGANAKNYDKEVD